MDLIFAHMGERDGGVSLLTMNDFVRAMDSNSAGGASPLDTPRSSYTSSSGADDILASIRSRLQLSSSDRSLTSTGSKKISIVALENALHESCSGNDPKNKSLVTKKQFSSAMEQVGIRLRALDVDGLFRSLTSDRRHHDVLSYLEFVDALVAGGKRESGPASPSRRGPPSPQGSARTPRSPRNDRDRDRDRGHGRGREERK